MTQAKRPQHISKNQPPEQEGWNSWLQFPPFMKALVPAGSSRHNRDEMILPGLVSVTFRSLPPEEVVELATRAGLAGIEWAGDVHVSPGDLETAARVRDLTESAGMKVVSYGSYYWAGQGKPFDEIVATVRALGAPNVRVCAGATGSAEGPWKPVVEDLQALCTACPELTVSLEFHSGTLTDTLASTIKVLEEVQAPNLRTYWQPVVSRSHAERMGELAALQPSLSHLHVFQWVDGSGEIVRRPLIEGEDEWRDYLRLAGGERFALIEFVPNDDPSILKSEAEVLRGWLS